MQSLIYNTHSLGPCMYRWWCVPDWPELPKYCRYRKVFSLLVVCISGVCRAKVPVYHWYKSLFHVSKIWNLCEGSTFPHSDFDPEEDHHRVTAAALRPPPDWRRPPGHPRSTWLRLIDEDVQPQNFGVHTAWRKAKDRDTWHQVVSTVMFC